MPRPRNTASRFTQRRAARRTYRQEPVDYQLMIDGIQGYAVFLLDPQGKILTWSKGARRLLGYTPTEIIGKNFSVLFSPADRRAGKPRQKLRQARLQESSEDEHAMRRKNGSYFWARGRNFPLWQSGKKLRGFVKIAHDITNHKLMREALAQHQERLQLAHKVGNIGTFEWNIATGVITWTAELEALYGLPPGSFKGTYENWAEHLHPDDRPRAQESLRQAAVEGSDVNLEFRVIWPDQSLHHLVAKAHVFRDHQGHPQRLIGINMDITNQKQTSEQLKQSEEQYRLVVENTSDVIKVLDIQGNYVYASPSHHRLLGYQPQALVSKSAFTFIHPEDLAAMQQQFTKAIQGEAGSATYRFRHSQGHYLTLEGTSTAIFNNEHQPYLVVSTAHDITARTELEQQKDAFIGIASHELKTPITSLKAYAQMLQRRFLRRHDHEAALYLAKMDAQLNKLTNLISDLLDVTKIEAGRLLLHQELFDFDALVKEIVDGIQLTTQHHRIIQQGSLGKKLYGDRDRIGQVLINLMTNAIKYSPGADKIIVRISGTKDAAVVAVQDFGIGISPKKQEKVFDRFFRVNDSRSHTFPGLGLGLFISAEIIKRQGGDIWVKSTAGKGSTFSFSLPLMPVPITPVVPRVNVPQPVRHG